MICHGNPDGDHCCYVNGVRCPLLRQGAEIAVEVQAVVDRYALKGQARNLALRIGDGITYACAAALDAIGSHVSETGQEPPRAEFEARWNTHGPYQPIADAWELIGKPRNWCVQYGPPEQQCCFSEDQTTNDSRASGIPVSLRNLRSQVTGV